LNLESEKIKIAIANVLKGLDIAYVDDDPYQRLVNIGLLYDYIESDLLEQLIEAELIILLDRRSF